MNMNSKNLGASSLTENVTLMAVLFVNTLGTTAQIGKYAEMLYQIAQSLCCSFLFLVF